MWAHRRGVPGALEKADSCKHGGLLGEALGKETSRHFQNCNLSAQGVLFTPGPEHTVFYNLSASLEKKKEDMQKGLGVLEDNWNNGQHPHFTQLELTRI